ncbi:MAG: hypothetical protein WAW02_00800 [Sideroxyarcus sp.]
MSKYTVFKSRTVLLVCFAGLSTISGLASCGGAKLSATTSEQYRSPDLYVSASPSLIAYNAVNKTSVISWRSLGDTCSYSPGGENIKELSYSFTTPSLTKTTTYTIMCGTGNNMKVKRATVALAPASLVDPIITQQNSCRDDTLARTTTYYYCDCGKGADANCDRKDASGNQIGGLGDDANDGLTPSTPRRSLADIARRYSIISGTTKFAFCKGGAFDATRSLSMPDISCTAGTTCTDFREYAHPNFTSSAKPIINSAPGGEALFRASGSTRGGVRFLNLKLHGNGTAGNQGVFFYGGMHDVTVCNLDIEGFSSGISQNGGNILTGGTISPNPNITITGNNFTNNIGGAYFGGGPNAEISKNFIADNGGNNLLDHSIYLAGHPDSAHMNLSGNYIGGQIGEACAGVVIVVHGQVLNLSIMNNMLEIDPAASTTGCYGIALDHGGYTEYGDYSSAVISSNTLANTGGIGIALSQCADCVVQDNLIRFDTATAYGIVGGSLISRTTYPDVVNNRNKIVNNTIWLGPDSTGGLTGGIQVRNEGTGHIVANNTVNYTSTNAGRNDGVNCFNYPLAAVPNSYAFIDNNHCYSAAATYKWEKTYGTATAWRTAYPGFDAASVINNSAPAFVNTTTFPYDFHPSGLPLLGAGTSTHLPVPPPAKDITGTNFLPSPAIGAYE